MNAENSVRELAKVYISDNHNVHGVEFMDQLLLVALEFGEVKCGLASDQQLRFDVGNQPAFVIETGRARTKLRALCARLAGLCHESGGQDVSPYGGEGFIQKQVPLEHALTSHGRSATGKNAGPFVSNGPSQQRNISFEGLKKWNVRFMNTTSEHHFTITPAEER